MSIDELKPSSFEDWFEVVNKIKAFIPVELLKETAEAGCQGKDA